VNAHESTPPTCSPFIKGGQVGGFLSFIPVFRRQRNTPISGERAAIRAYKGLYPHSLAHTRARRYYIPANIHGNIDA